MFLSFHSYDSIFHFRFSVCPMPFNSNNSVLVPLYSQLLRLLLSFFLFFFVIFQASLPFVSLLKCMCISRLYHFIFFPFPSPFSYPSLVFPLPYSSAQCPSIKCDDSVIIQYLKTPPFGITAGQEFLTADYHQSPARAADWSRSDTRHSLTRRITDATRLSSPPLPPPSHARAGRDVI